MMNAAGFMTCTSRGTAWTVTAFVNVLSGFAIRSSPGKGRVCASAVARTRRLTRLTRTADIAIPAAATADHVTATRSRARFMVLLLNTAIDAPRLTAKTAQKSGRRIAVTKFRQATTEK